jgi:hypothetical protein
MGIPAKKKPNSDEQQAPKTWWQWVFLYPALVIAIITAVPQWVQTAANWRSGIPLKQIETAKDQGALWKKNLSCTSAPLDPYLSPKNIKVDAHICASGDVFVRMFSPDRAPSYYWVDVDKEASTEVGSNFTTEAYAGELTPYTVAQNTFQDTSQGVVMCQKFLDERNLLRVVKVNNACFDEVVDTFLGVTTSQSASECRSEC